MGQNLAHRRQGSVFFGRQDPPDGPPRAKQKLPAALYWRAMPTCMVTGGAGFLGSHLCDELLARGNRVICVDNLETGSLANIEHIRDPECFEFLHVDITAPYFVEEPVDFVYHFAS